MAANNEWVIPLLMGMGRLVPMFIVWFIGLVIALVRWPRCPGVSALVFAAIVVAGGTNIATQVIYAVLPRVWEPMQFARVAAIIGFASAFVSAGAWGCMLTAAFMGRGSMPDQADFGEMTKTPAGEPR